MNDSESYAGTANTVMLVLGLLFFTKKYRTDNEEIFFSFGKTFKISFLIGLYAAILVSFFNYVFYKFSPEAMHQMLLSIQNVYQESGALSGDDLEALLKLIQQYMTPGFVAFSSLFGITLEVTIFSLIIAFFISRKPLQGKSDSSAFDRDMSKLNE